MDGLKKGYLFPYIMVYIKKSKADCILRYTTKMDLVDEVP